MARRRAGADFARASPASRDFTRRRGAAEARSGTAGAGDAERRRDGELSRGFRACDAFGGMGDGERGGDHFAHRLGWARKLVELRRLTPPKSPFTITLPQ